MQKWTGTRRFDVTTRVGTFGGAVVWGRDMIKGFDAHYQRLSEGWGIASLTLRLKVIGFQLSYVPKENTP